MMHLANCADAIGAALHGDNVSLNAVSIDSRTLSRGDFYVALKGERFDGHDYIDAAVAGGAAGVMVDAERSLPVPQLVIDDTRRGLGLLGKYKAGRHKLPTVAITGSNGKTTVKEIVTTILRLVGPVCATRGNLNNDIGVPLTLLSRHEEHRFAVVEMGANHAGEIDWLTGLTAPDVALVNNVEAAHLEGFGSLEGVAHAKAEIYRGLGSDGVALINGDSPYAPVLRAAAAHCRRIEFGTTATAGVRLLEGPELQFELDGRRHTAAFGLPGRHNAMNAVAAVAATWALGIGVDAIVAGLAGVAGVKGRLEIKRGLQDAVLIDDTYNASPAATRSAIDVLAQRPGRRILVLGDMLELGADAGAMHRQAGQYARGAGIDSVLTLGSLAAEAAAGFGQGEAFGTLEPLLSRLQTMLDADTVVLVKGSRGSRMERVVERLVAVEGVPAP